MTDPCIADTDTVALRIANGALEANVQVSADIGNAVQVTDGGLYVPGPVNDTARLFGTGQATPGSSTKNAVTLSGTRFASPAGMVTAGPAITVLRTGLWHVAGVITWGAPGLSGSYRLVSIKAGAVQTYPSLEPTQTATAAFNTSFMTPTFSGVVFLTIGTTLTLEYQDDSAAVSSLITLENAGIELMANLLLEVT